MSPSPSLLPSPSPLVSQVDEPLPQQPNCWNQ
eukprot:CAMPEP_0197557378 /NCGR_PEP_ID=MMETSP1320-20131121/16998_1 /TAXON_ID=91990 /ORGANISM="Bolidomonas sp., Strain RCC2347" /LENGTH=31 /DNA_ID= /DNA_START= /DNA_END= /DNA_ORIENTATION=